MEGAGVVSTVSMRRGDPTQAIFTVFPPTLYRREDVGVPPADMLNGGRDCGGPRLSWRSS